jgi:hypothetical protein
MGRVEELTRRISELQPRDQWRLLLFLVSRHRADAMSGLSQINAGSGYRQDIQIRSWTLRGDEAAQPAGTAQVP